MEQVQLFKPVETAETKATPVPFDQLTAPQQRVAIARDVIAQLNAKRYIATHNIYYGPKGMREAIDNGVADRLYYTPNRVSFREHTPHKPHPGIA